VKVIRKHEVERFRAPSTVFTGEVWVDPVFDAPEPGRTGSSFVTFEPGARTHWHAHPFGQILNVKSGRGFVQWKGGPAFVIEEGDSVWIGPDEIHAHGAAPDSAMCHMAITERNAEQGAGYFLGPVTDDEYQRPFQGN
jgi:quercetin dioxygenase-like cupin family protein